MRVMSPLCTSLAVAALLGASSVPSTASATHGDKVDGFAVLVATSAYAEADCPGVHADRASLDEFRRAVGIGDADAAQVKRTAVAAGKVFAERIKAVTPSVWCKGIYALVGKGGKSTFTFLDKGTDEDEDR